MVRDMIDFANQRTVAAERERDEHKHRAVNNWRKCQRLEADLFIARSERDAALAKVAELEKVLAAVRGVVK
jgi:hypothetical protein